MCLVSSDVCVVSPDFTDLALTSKPSTLHGDDLCIDLTLCKVDAQNINLHVWMALRSMLPSKGSSQLVHDGQSQ